jgi:IS30 family transposase
LVTHKFKIEDSRRKVAKLIAQSMTETEIALELRVDQSTISRDIKALKELSQRFVFDLAKSDLAYYYKQCIDGIEEVRRKGLEIFKGCSNLTAASICIWIHIFVLYSTGLIR